MLKQVSCWRGREKKTQRMDGRWSRQVKWKREIRTASDAVLIS